MLPIAALLRAFFVKNINCWCVFGERAFFTYSDTLMVSAAQCSVYECATPSFESYYLVIAPYVDSP